MPLCFIEPHDAVRVIADSLSREGRRQLVDEILHLLAAWHASLEFGQPLPSMEFLAGVFQHLGDNRREALKIAVRFRGEEPSREPITERHALEVILPRLSRARAVELLHECLSLYAWDRMGTSN